MSSATDENPSNTTSASDNNLPPKDSLHEIEASTTEQPQKTDASPVQSFSKSRIFTTEPQFLTSLSEQQKQLISDELKPLLSPVQTNTAKKGFSDQPMQASGSRGPHEYYYYCDRNRRWKMETTKEGHELLTRLVLEENRKLLELCCEKILKTKGSQTDLKAEIERGKRIYGEKKTYMEAKKRAQQMRFREGQKSSYERNSIFNAEGELPNNIPDPTKVATWSDEEYKHLGFQFEYLKLKSLQRFTENYSLLERCWDKGLFVEYAKGTSKATAADPMTMRVVSLGGGPGFELFAFRCFAEKHFSPHVQLKLISLDLEASWKESAETLGNEFMQWDVENGMDVTRDTGDKADFVMLSYVVFHYMNEKKHAEQFRDLILRERTKALLVNSRVQRLNSVDQVEALGIPVVRLISQTLQRDDRQVLYLHPNLRMHDLPLEDQLRRNKGMAFPNVPYEEHKTMGNKRKRY